MLIKKYLLLLVQLSVPGILLAQPAIKPVNNAGVPAPTQTVVPLPAAYNSNATVNYIRVWEPTSPITNETVVPTKAVDEVKVTSSYHDGLGRPLQTVVKAITPGAKDMVSYKTYDDYGRETYQYLPYPDNGTDGSLKTNPFLAQQQFYQTRFGNTEQVFYGYSDIENNPLQRPLKTYAPGNSWAGSGNGVESKYLFNWEVDDVKKWTIDDAPGSVPQAGNAYGDGELSKTVVIDEQGSTTVEYKNKEGRVILKKAQSGNTAIYHRGYTGFACTYYIYDKYSQLRFVIQPRAVEWLLQNSWSFGATGGTDIIDELCFRYEYDARNRMIRKKVPGAGWVDMVYDTRDRLVMTRDAKMAADGKWMVSFYDELGRPIIIGLWTNSNDGNTHRAAAYPLAQYPATNISGFELLTQTWYDDYTGITTASGLSAGLNSSAVSNGGFYTTYNVSPYWAQQITEGTITRGLVTGSKTKILGTGSYLYSLVVYDEKGRAIQVKSTNSSGGTDIATTQYDFSGKVLKTYLVHAKSGTNAQAHYVKTKMEYDDAGRVKKIWKNIDNAGSDQLISETIYNEQGQLVTKKLGTNPVNTSQPLETLTYDYNIRGWLNGINKDYAEGFNNNNWFGMTLSYDYGFTYSEGGYAGNYSLLNGNISGWKWRGKSDGEQRAYGYEYDKLNRLKYADFNQWNIGSTAWNKNIQGSSNTIDFSVGGSDNNRMGYDANGNILSMKQWGLKLNNSSVVDEMAYTYEKTGQYSNKLKQVLDNQNDYSSKLGDFKYDANTKTSTDYGYDVNGNMTSDANKAITSITYNNLNLPQTITVTNKGTISYTYDAAGNKLSKTVNETGQPAKTTLYITGFIYENDVLQFTGHEEGRARPLTAGGWTYDYFVKDHLGNVRVMLTQEQKTDDYPMATLETATLSNEQVYYNVPDASGVRVNKNTVSGYPTDNTTSPNDFIHKLNGSGTQKGSSIVLKVMSGDKFNIQLSSWWTGSGSFSQPANTLTELLGVLNPGIASQSSGKITEMQLSSGNVLTPALNMFFGDNSTVPTDKPKAGLNWILFDEQMNYVQAGSGTDPVSGSSNQWKSHVLSNLTMPKSGYLYIYVINETPGVNVYFDNLKVAHVRGPLLEVSHYYPFGLSMAGINSKALGFGGSENRYKYNGIEQNNDLDLNMYDAFYRNLDPQIGRFWQIDPKLEKSPDWSPFSSMHNNPILKVDPLGDDDYTVNKNGEIKLLKKTDDEKDRLIAVSGKKEQIKYNKKGILKNASMELDKGIVSERKELKQTVQDEGKDVEASYMRLDFQGKEEVAQKTFEFLANNTDVEWSLVTFATNDGSSSSIYTSHLGDREYFGGKFAYQLSLNSSALTRLGHTHNHPSGVEDMRGAHSDADENFRNITSRNYPAARFFIYENGINYEYTEYKKKKKK